MTHRHHIARQVCLASVAGMAVYEGLNGRLIVTYFVAALLMAGVDAAEIREAIFGD